jgi:hypothetical protein
VLELVAEVSVAVVGGVLGPHLPEDFQPAHSQAAQGRGVAHALFSFLPVIGIGPGRLDSAAVGPQVDGGTEVHVAGSADDDVSTTARLPGDWGGSAVALQRLGVSKHFPIRAQFGQEPRGKFFAGSWKGTEQVVVWMPTEQFLDAGSVLVQLRVEGSELLGAGNGQQAFGGGDGGIGAGAAGGGTKQLQPLGGSFGAVELMGVEELLPLAFAGAGQVVGSGESQDELPGAAHGPVIEGGDGRGVILVQRGLELVDQGGALPDENDLVPAPAGAAHA